ncbi:MAG: GCN5-related N-acetyltransferase [Methanoculleus marisnigri]|uniref:GCN5-related N-acetyltransferase n=1 Tax=Methanoculleus marisnigri TaxID=2198 RepID=A0A117LRB0_9EURY|nr:MAG: GCN5-related N-acetyltransferase [Methanoculleus marisnigri]
MMEEADIEVRLVDVWDVETIADLYRAGGWWNEKWNPASLGGLIPPRAPGQGRRNDDLISAAGLLYLCRCRLGRPCRRTRD